MLNKLDYVFHGLGYLFNTKVLRREIPYVGALVINERCNLKCSHCQVSNRALEDLTYEEAKSGLNTFYEMGIRSLAIGGGSHLYGETIAVRLKMLSGLQEKWVLSW